MARRWSVLALLVFAGSCFSLDACPSQAGGSCEPRHENCPVGYYCALAEVCTRTCEQTSDCWVRAEQGCRPDLLPFQRLPDGGTFQETVDDAGICPETKRLEFLEGYCQLSTCADGGCDYDLYGPSPFKGNR